MRRILVLRGGALGDFIVTLPALAQLRRRWPEARIELVGNATAAQLARARGFLDAVHSQHEARWSPLFGETPLPPDLSAWLGAFDLVVNYWPDPDGALRRRFPLRRDQVFLTADAMPARAPAAAHYCEPLRQLGLETAERWVRLAPLAREADTASSSPDPTSPRPILVHPGSGSPRKNWPLENWRTILAELPRPVALVLGEAERARWSSVRSSRQTGLSAQVESRDAGLEVGPAIPSLVERPLEELVARFAACRLFLGHDSGISHLAAACGARCVLLFGPTEPALWAPPAPNVRVLRCSGDLASIPIAEVRQAVSAALADPP